MEATLFNRIYQDALDQPELDLFIAEYGYPDRFDEISLDANIIVDELGKIHKLANMSFRDILNEVGLTQTKCAKRFAIPLRTVQNWATDTRPCPEYVKLMMAEIMGLIERG